MEISALNNNIRANAELVIEHLSQHAGFKLAYDEPSVEWIDGFIERQRTPEDEEDGGGALAEKLGCFLGECLRVRLGGEWVETDEGQVGIRFSDGNMAFPIAKTRKQFAFGEGDSIKSFYDSAVAIFGRSANHD